MKALIHKNSDKKFGIDRKYSMLIFVITAVAATILRTYQLCTNMDFASGQYIDKSLAKNYPLIIIVLGAVLLLLILRFGTSRDKAVQTCILLNPYKLKIDRLNKKVPLLSGVFMLVMAMLIAFEIFMEIITVIHKNKLISSEGSHVGMLSGINALGWVIYGFMLVAMATFISAGYNILKGDGVTKGNAFFFAVYSITKLLQVFKLVADTELIGLYPEKIYIMLCCMSASVFFAYTARFFFDCEKKNTKLWMCFFGYMTGILAAASVVPRYMMFFLIDYAKRDGMLSPDVSDMALIFLPASIISIFWSAYVYRVMPRLNLTGKRRWASSKTVVSR